MFRCVAGVLQRRRVVAVYINRASFKLYLFFASIFAKRHIIINRDQSQLSSIIIVTQRIVNYHHFQSGIVDNYD